MQVILFSTLQAEPLLSLFLSRQETEKKALHKFALTFEVAVAPTLGLVIPVYFRQTGCSSASVNFYEKPMVETEPTEKHGGKITGRLYPRDVYGLGSKPYLSNTLNMFNKNLA